MSLMNAKRILKCEHKTNSHVVGTDLIAGTNDKFAALRMPGRSLSLSNLE
jgi:hypothetical protein